MDWSVKVWEVGVGIQAADEGLKSPTQTGKKGEYLILHFLNVMVKSACPARKLNRPSLKPAPLRDRLTQDDGANGNLGRKGKGKRPMTA